MGDERGSASGLRPHSLRVDIRQPGTRRILNLRLDSIFSPRVRTGSSRPAGAGPAGLVIVLVRVDGHGRLSDGTMLMDLTKVSPTGRRSSCARARAHTHGAGASHWWNRPRQRHGTARTISEGLGRTRVTSTPPGGVRRAERGYTDADGPGRLAHERELTTAARRISAPGSALT